MFGVKINLKNVISGVCTTKIKGGQHKFEGEKDV